MTITYEKLVNYTLTAGNFIRKKHDNAKTKLGYAIQKMSKPMQKALKPYNELIEQRDAEVEEINIRNASTDATTKVLVFDITKDETGKEVRNYRYTPDALIKRNKEIKEKVKEFGEKIEALLESETTIEPYFATEVPPDLTQEEKEYMAGIVIAPLKVKSNGAEAAELLEVL